MALQNGEVEAVIVDSNAVEDLTPAFPDEGDATGPFADLRRLPTLDGTQFSGPFEIRPALPGRYVVVVRADEAGTLTSFSQIASRSIGTIAEGQAVDRFLSQPRNLVLVDLRITNDLNMPHLQSIAVALLQPARRNGPVLLTRILAESALTTWGEALMGFVAGGLLGFLLGTVYAHSKLLERRPFQVTGTRLPALRGGLADGADPGSCADGGDRAGVRAGGGGRHQRLSDVLPGDNQYPARPDFAHNQYPARPDFAQANRAGIDAFLCGDSLGNHVEAALSGGLAVYLHGAESLRHSQHRGCHHW